MRIYSSVFEAVKEIERDLAEMGIFNKAPTVQDLDVRENPDYDSKELPGYAYMITKFDDLKDIFKFFFENTEDRISDMLYSQAELDDRIYGLGLNPGNSWVWRANYWRKFLKEGKFSYTYSERIHWQLGPVLNELSEAKGSRQCIITIYDSCKDLQNMGGKARIPCSMYYQFLRREISGKDSLMLIYTMRSCDFYTHFPIDVWLAIKLGKWMAECLKIDFYNFTHFIGSLHAFRKDYEKRRIF